MTQPHPLTDKQQYWLEHILACDNANLSSKDYAMANGLSVTALYSWRKKLRRKGMLKPREHTLFARASLTPTTGHCQISLPDGLVVSLDTHCDPLWAASLIKALA